MPPTHAAVPDHIELLARGVAVRNGKVLLCRNVHGGYTYLPGGHVEPGEAAADALAREFLEETGEQVRVGGFLLAAEARFTQNGRPRHECNLAFHVEHTGGEFRSVEPDIAFEWAAPEELADRDFRPLFLRDWLAQTTRTIAAGEKPIASWRASGPEV